MTTSKKRYNICLPAQPVFDFRVEQQQQQQQQQRTKQRKNQKAWECTFRRPGQWECAFRRRRMGTVWASDGRRTGAGRAADGLCQYSARPRTSMTRAGDAKGGAGGEAPHQIHPKYGFSSSHTGFRGPYTGSQRPYTAFRCPKILFSRSKIAPRSRKSVLTTSKLMFGGRESRLQRRK